mgnify:CR=1 FL=1
MEDFNIGAISEYDAQKLEHLSEDELSESAKKFGVKTRVNRHGEISLEILISMMI